MGRRYRDKRLYDRGGKYIWARVKDEHGLTQRITTGKTTEEAATAFADEWERRAADPGYRRAAEATVGSATQDWLEHLKRKGMKAVTFGIAQAKTGQFLRHWGEAWPLLRVNDELVLRYIDVRRDEEVKSLTIKRELDHLRRMLEWAKFRGTFPRDIATVIPPDFSGEHKPKTRAPTPAEVVALLMQLEARRGAHVAFIVATGARWSESVRACRDDVQLDKGIVAIRGSKTELSAAPVPITGLTHPFLIYALQHAPESAPLFDPWGKYWRDIQAACRRAGVEPLSPNDLRRAFGTWHRKAGASAEEISIMLRHATDRLAQTTYARVTGADLVERLQKLVPVLYAEPAQTTQSGSIDQCDSTEKQAPPAEIESATFGLGSMRPADASTRRGVGTKLGLASRRK